MIRKRLTYANMTSTLALLLALSGIAYAAALPRNSVGKKQLKQGAVTTPKLEADAVTANKVEDFDLRLGDLGGRINNGTASVSSPIIVPPDGCMGEGLTLRNPAPPRFIGSLVVGFLTDAQGDAELANAGFVVPTIISETSQGGAIPNLMVCDRGGSGFTVPVGSIFHYQTIGP